jgi:4-carboxymuconolactone decarboxylase
MHTPSHLPSASAPFGAQPRLAELSQTLLFGEIWARPVLDRRERSLITLAALLALGRAEQFAIHLGIAETHGLSAEEVSELITHLAFYAGWPAAHTASCVLAERQEAK